MLIQQAYDLGNRFGGVAYYAGQWPATDTQGCQRSKRCLLHIDAVERSKARHEVRGKYLRHASNGSLLSMTSRAQHTVTINHPANKVHAALTNADYWAYNVANLSTEAGEVHSFDGNEAVLYEIMPMDLLPEAVRAMISQSLKIKRVVTVSELDGDSFTFNYTADVKGAPVDFKGSVAAAGADTTTLTYDNEVNVTIPFMGPAIEPKVAEALGELVANEGALTEKWISENL